MNKKEIIQIIKDRSPKNGGSEHLLQLPDVLHPQDGVLRVVSPVCANYETIKANGERIPLVRPLPLDLISTYTMQGEILRRGAALFAQEIPGLLSLLSETEGINSVRHLVILVDYGMSPTLWGKKAQKYHQKNGPQLQEEAKNSAVTNAETLQELERWGVSQLKAEDEKIETRVMALSEIVGLLDDSTLFDQVWTQIYHLMMKVLDKENDKAIALIRNALKKDGRYLRQAWGITNSEQIQERTVRDNFALTDAFARLLPQLYAAPWDEEPLPRRELLMADTIPGPDNPGHTEFSMYNTSSEYLDEEFGSKEPMTILRPFCNLVLLNQLAVESPWITGSLDQVLDDILTAIDNGELNLPSQAEGQK